MPEKKSISAKIILKKSYLDFLYMPDHILFTGNLLPGIMITPTFIYLLFWFRMNLLFIDNCTCHYLTFTQLCQGVTS